jgi:nickel/cobalt exporter
MRRASQVMRVIFKFSWAFAVAVVTGMMMPCSVQAHPMGNFSINHYAKLVPGTETIELDYIIDMAEIPIET